MRAQRDTRAADRDRLLAALDAAGLAPGAGASPPALAEAVHAYLARTPCRLASVQMEDVLGIAAQANVPGTIDAHPNWRRKLPLPIDLWSGHAPLVRLARTFSAAR